MEQSTITRIVSDAEHATTLPELKRALENVALVVAMLNRELNDLRQPNPANSTATALLKFQAKTKNRVRR